MDTDNTTDFEVSKQAVRPGDCLAFCEVGTVLRGLGRYHSKSYRASANGRLKRVETPRPKFHLAEAAHAAGLDDLVQIYAKVLADPTACLVRGQLREDEATKAALAARRVQRGDVHLVEAPRPWVALDIDEVDLGDIDVVAAPEAAVEAALEYLGNSAAFRALLDGVDVGWALSSSAGLRKSEEGLYAPDSRVFKAHLLLWVDAPVTSTQVRALIKSGNTELAAQGLTGVDQALAGFNQPHYGSPRLLGLKDWLPRRHGVVRRGRAAASVSAFDGLKVARPAPPRTRAKTPALPVVTGSRRALTPEGIAFFKRKWALKWGDLQRAPLGQRTAELIKVAAYWGNVGGQVRLEDAIGTLDEIAAKLAAVYGRDGDARQVANLLAEGQRGYPEPIAEHLLIDPDAPLREGRVTVEDVRAHVALHSRLEALTAGVGINLAQGPGSGKSYIKRQRAREVARDEVLILVGKDRRAVLQDAQALADLGAVAFVGRRRLGKEDDWGWKPEVVRDETGAHIDAATCARADAGKGVRVSCDKHCPWHQRCLQGGYLGRKRAAERVLQSGGIVACTLQLLPMLIKAHWTLKEKGQAAPVRAVWCDDTEAPGVARVTLKALWAECEKLHDEAQYAAMRAFIDALEELTENAPEGVDEINGRAVIEASALLVGHEEDLKIVGRRLGAPAALSRVIEWVCGGVAARGNMVLADGAWALEVHPRGLKLPPESAFVLSHATADVALWEAYTGRAIERKALDADLPDTFEVVHLDQSTFGKARRSDPREVFRDRIKPCVTEIHARLRHLAGRLDTRPEKLKVLIVAHKAMIEAPVWAVTEQELTGAYPRSTTVHWRGVEQVGSNLFEHHDAVVLLDLPRMNLGAWKRHKRAWAATRDLQGLPEKGLQAYESEALGRVAQGVGRIRATLAKRAKLAIFVATEVPHRFAKHAQQLRAVHKTGPKAGAKVADWLSAQGFQALTCSMHKMKGAPCKDSLRAAFRACTDPVWTVKVKGSRGHGQQWKGRSEEVVRDGFQKLLRGAGRGVPTAIIIKRVDPVRDGLIKDDNLCIKTGSTNFSPFKCRAGRDRPDLQKVVDDPPRATPGAALKDHRVLKDDSPLEVEPATGEDQSWEAWFEDAAAAGFPASLIVEPAVESGLGEGLLEAALRHAEQPLPVLGKRNCHEERLLLKSRSPRRAVHDGGGLEREPPAEPRRNVGAGPPDVLEPVIAARAAPG